MSECFLVLCHYLPTLICMCWSLHLCGLAHQSVFLKTVRWLHSAISAWSVPNLLATT